LDATQNSIIKAISKGMSTGEVHYINPEDATNET